MQALTHKIKCALDLKTPNTRIGNIQIKTEVKDGKTRYIALIWDTCGIVYTVSFDKYVPSPYGGLYIYCEDHYLGILG